MSSVRVFASAVSPYSGTIQSPGKLQQSILVGGIRVTPGEIAVGDNDGVIVAPMETFEKLLPFAKKIQHIEERVRARLQAGESIEAISNYREHIEARMELEPSSFEFRLDS
jgi:4-hydroxy-4-methyl-2-oxoglutarate aldolase